ncbi:hypothetical protein [Clostridium grantii]|uniref:Uncharacterized protein n=1 Tax=Clostridium grantii DSM 8605 TaxID=1121316 RepID=A0A1M5SCA1_9CLOT|nr:hypothetical protein [Clostridium grantii]SHH36091.1 hypothetical protein SAMN02745207_00861 [Clostridium grantii DSM 8605]
MRNIVTADLFTIAKIVKKMNVKQQLKQILFSNVEDIKGKTDNEIILAKKEAQFEIIMMIIENIDNAEQDLYAFLAKITEQKAKDIQNMEIDKFIELMQELFESESFNKVFTVALR